MDSIIQKGIKDYKYIPYDDIESIPLGSHIKFIDRNENIKSGGFLTKIFISNNYAKSYFLLKSNILYKLYFWYYWIFYKNPSHIPPIIKLAKEITLNSYNESKKDESSVMNIVIKPKTRESSSNKAKVFRSLLETLEKQKNDT